MNGKTIAALLVAATCCAGATAGATPRLNEPEAGSGEEEELRKEYEEIDRMLREDDSRAPIDYGYGPGVLPPDDPWLDMPGGEAPDGAKPSGAGR